MRLPWQRRAAAPAPNPAPARASFGGFGIGSAVVPVQSIAESATGHGIALICLAAARAELTVRNRAGAEIEHALLDALAAPNPAYAGNQGELLAALVREVYASGYAIGRAVRSAGRIIEVRPVAGGYLRRGRVYDRGGRAIRPNNAAVFALGRYLDGTPIADHVGAIRNASMLSQSAEQAMGRVLRANGLSIIVRKRAYNEPGPEARAANAQDAQVNKLAADQRRDQDAGGPSVETAPGAGPVPYFEIDSNESIDVIRADAQQLGIQGAAADARRRVANALSIPAALISGEAAGPELESAWALFGRTVAPRLAAMIEAALQPLLGVGERVRVRPQSMELGAADQIAVLLSMREAHLLSVNDVLSDLGRPRRSESWADDPRLVAGNYQPLRGDPTGAAGGQGANRNE